MKVLPNGPESNPDIRSSREALPSEASAENAVGKLIVFAGLETGAGKALCAANVAVRLARRWRGLAVDMDPRPGNLHAYLGAEPPGGRSFTPVEEQAGSLGSFTTRTRVPDLDLIHWPGTAATPPMDRVLEYEGGFRFCV